MNERFENSPLREIVAELSWDVSHEQSDADVSEPIFSQAYEETFDDFLDRVSERGYSRSERLVPQNFPCPPDSAVVRAMHPKFRREDSEGAKVLYQLGVGIFTANALPPYRSWDDFSPLVRSGVEDLLTLNFPGRNPGRLRPKLRYINAFHEDIIQGRSHKEFISEAFGVSVDLPEGVQGESCGDINVPLLDFHIPLEFGRMHVRAGEGVANGNNAFLLDMTVTYGSELPRDSDEIMMAFGEGRKKIHKVFVALTENIHDQLGLVRE